MSRLLKQGLVLALLLAFGTAVTACPVCYGGADDKMMDGVQAGVLLLLAIIGSVLVGFAALFLRFRHLAKKVAQAEAAENVTAHGGVI